MAAVVTDVGFRHPADIERLRHLLSQPRAMAVPIVAILRDNSHLERVQAVAVGATFLFPADVSVSDIAAALAPIIRSTIPWVEPATSLAPGQNIEQARFQFGTIFRCSRARRTCQQDECRQRDSVRHGRDSRRRHPTMARSCLDL